MNQRVGGAWDAPWRVLDQVLGMLLLLMVTLTVGLVVARYLFGVGSIATQEAVLWLHSTVFLLGSASALRADKHVRVDVLLARWSPRTRALVDCLGMLVFLLPFAGFMLVGSLEYVAASWSLREASREPGGLPAVYLLKTLIPTAAVLLGLQGLLRAWRSWRLFRGADA